MSADGRYEVFTSSASDLVAGMSDTNGSSDVFVRDLQTGVTTLVSVNTAGTAAGNGASDSGVISADGRYVAFRSYATDLATPATDGNSNIFVRDLQTGVTTLVSVNTAGTGGANSYSDEPTISGDGSLVAFRSYATNLVSTPDNNGNSDIFLRNWQAATPSTVLVTTNSAGTAAGNNSSDTPVLSKDGSTLAFDSYDSDLVAGVTDNNASRGRLRVQRGHRSGQLRQHGIDHPDDGE